MKKVFEASVIELCRSLSKEEIRVLDAILKQKKEEIEILKDIVQRFPRFNEIYARTVTRQE